jgi:hypothetical protein
MPAPSARPTLVTIIAIWLVIVFCFGVFGLASAAFLSSLRPDMPHIQTAQLALTVLSLLLALAGANTHRIKKPVSWQIIAGRVVVDVIALVLTLVHPAALSAAVANNPQAAAISSMAKTTGLITGVVMLAVNIAIALCARNVTTKTAAVVESTPTAV